MSESLKFYRTLYDAEWTRRDEIRQAIALPAGVLTILAGVLVFYARSYSFPDVWTSIIFLLGYGAGLVAFGAGVYMLARSLSGPRYLRIPWPSQIRDFEEKLGEYYDGKEGGAELARIEWERHLIDRYVDAANRNSENNARVGEYLYKANRAVVLTIIAAAITAVPVVVDQRASNSAPQRIEIINSEVLYREGRDQPGVREAVEQPGAAAGYPQANHQSDTATAAGGDETVPPTEYRDSHGDASATDEARR